jgi:hypothetical protein
MIKKIKINVFLGLIRDRIYMGIHIGGFSAFKCYMRLDYLGVAFASLATHDCPEGNLNDNLR